MHVGMSTFFQNLSGLTDREVYHHEVSMADLAEPLGFDSVWAAEHHFDHYTMCPNVAQFLTYMAGRTKRGRRGLCPRSRFRRQGNSGHRAGTWAHRIRWLSCAYGRVPSAICGIL
jgi:hypothetical protein